MTRRRQVVAGAGAERDAPRGPAHDQESRCDEIAAPEGAAAVADVLRDLLEEIRAHRHRTKRRIAD